MPALPTVMTATEAGCAPNASRGETPKDPLMPAAFLPGPTRPSCFHVEPDVWLTAMHCRPAYGAELVIIPAYGCQTASSEVAEPLVASEVIDAEIGPRQL